MASSKSNQLPPQPGTPVTDTEALRQKLRERLPWFDIPALVDLLLHLGYSSEHIEYRSHRSTARPTQLIQAIDFQDDPPRVIVTVNLGLLGLQTPLPGFFLQAMEQDDQDKLERFFAFLDHSLLQSRFANLYPERDPAIMPAWQRTQRDLLRLLRPKSPVTLHWLFKHAFPELQVEVRRALRKQSIPSSPVRLGNVTLGGDSALGGEAFVPTGGLEVTLYAEDAYTPTGISWVEEARQRLASQVLPHLRETDLLLRVSLVVQERSTHARLAPGHYVGFDAIRGAERRSERLVLFDGTASS